ncbi:MAG: ABC transporter ATP-binding protein [Gemmatimonadetes bacterium]|nr:ABC transporter ATP-binding protein [Gemmatimonadota bacterium]
MADSSAAPKPPNLKRLKSILPDVWALIWPRRYLLGLGFLLIVVNRVAGMVLPTSSKFLIDDVIGGRRVDLLLPLVLIVGSATLLQAGTSFALTHLLSKAAQRLIAELREKVMHHVIHLSVSYFDQNKTGALVSRIMSDVEGIRNLIGTGLVELAGGILSAALAVGIMFSISPTMTGLTALFLAGFVVALYFAFGKMRPVFRERGKINAEVTGRLTETLGGVRVVKGYRREEAESHVFHQGVLRLLNNVLKTLTAMSVMGLSGSLLIGLVGATVMWVGARQVLAGNMTLGGLFTYTILLGFLVAPVVQVVSIGTQLTEALAGLERTREVLSEKLEDADPDRRATLPDIVGNVVFETVSFAYDGDRMVLRDVSFTARAGTVTALVGPSGAGKSTLIGLVASFHRPSNGRVLVDGMDLSTVTFDSYRTRLGVVLQDTFLFDGTIRENVAFARPEAAEQNILTACRQARVDEFAESMEKKYDTIVGERGVKLSGGQRQRVAIARAILANPRILILDEATSSLDSESEALIQEALGYLMKGRTTFVIAHRLSTIRRADQILVLERGEIVERGTHASLYARQGRYYDMYTKQHGVEANLFLAPGEGEQAAVEEPERPRQEPAGWIPRL